MVKISELEKKLLSLGKELGKALNVSISESKPELDSMIIGDSAPKSIMEKVFLPFAESTKVAIRGIGAKR